MFWMSIFDLFLSHIFIIVPTTHSTFVVSTGGLLLEAYILLMGTTEINKEFKRRKKFRNEDGNIQPYSADEMARVIAAEGNRFHGYMLLGVQISGKARRQLFYPTFAASAHGLTKTGMDTLASYGFTSPHTTFYRRRDELVREHKQRIMSVMHTKQS